MFSVCQGLFKFNYKEFNYPSTYRNACCPVSIQKWLFFPFIISELSSIQNPNCSKFLNELHAKIICRTRCLERNSKLI